YFLTWPCALLALATHLVGMSFSYAFRHSEVREVIIKAKIPELFFAFASVFPILSNRFSLFSFGTGTYITIISTVIGLVFIGSAKKMKISSFFDRSGLCIIGSLMMQMLCASCHLISTKTWQDAIPLSIAMLLWRCCLTLPLLFIHNRRGNKNSQVEVGGSSEAVLQARGALFATLRLLSTRAAFALATQFTFAWCVLEGPSYVIWPIFNTTPLVASIASQFILKERPHWSEIAALLCFFSGSTCMVFL
ncbi:MAG TPA: hypothetical protein DCE71_09045, partial [Parachlamydiales bacterium]|nr:hypothetical protein [Parachlamydiales bacterium]